MPENFKDITKPKDKKPDLLNAFKSSLLYSGIQSPLDAATQLYDHLTNSHTTKDVQFFAKPKQTKFNTATWYAQTLGSGLGTVADLIPLAFTSKFLVGSEVDAASSSLMNDRAALGLTLKESTVTGTLYGGLLEPSQGQNSNFYLNRMENSLSSALTFSAMTASSFGISKLAESNISDSMSKILGSKPVNAALSGIPGGILSSEGSSLIDHGKLASASSAAQSAYTMSLFGLAFSGIEQAKETLGSKIKDINIKADSLVPISQDSLSRNLTDTQDPKLANVDQVNLKKAIDKLNLDLKDIKLQRDGQYNVFAHTKSILAKLQASGEISRNWVLLPTQASSPADMVGCDYLLLNYKNGDFHFLDGTSNTQKAENPSAYNVAAIRQDGLIYFEPRWFDAMGKLKLEYDKTGRPILNDTDSLNMQQGNENIQNMLVKLTSGTSDFNLARTPLPSVKAVDPVRAAGEISNFIDWLNKEANQNGSNSFLLRDYARTLSKASQHLKIEASLKEADPTMTRTFGQRVQSVADKVILKYCVDKLLGKEPNAIKPNGLNSDVRYQPKQGVINIIMQDNSILQSPRLEKVLNSGVSNLFDTSNLNKLLTRNDGSPTGELASLQKIYPKLSVNDIIRKIQSVAMDNKNIILAGGATGHGEPVIISNMVNLLKSRSNTDLTR